MTERIEKLLNMTLSGEMWNEPVKTEFDREDLLLPKMQMESKRICEYILNQEPKLTEASSMTGFFRFDGSVVGDAFGRSGHTETAKIMNNFYLKPIDNISTMEWQHAAADYRIVIEGGIKGIKERISASLKVHSKEEETEFLKALDRVADSYIAFAHKCSERAAEFAKGVENEKYKANLIKLSRTFLRIPEYPAETFYEAVLCVYFCFSADPDSIGTLDRYLSKFYEKDIKEGRLTREEAKEYLQELFLMIQSATRVEANQFTRGGESHFAVGGYLENGEDGFSDTSRLIVEALLELPTWIPQITLRWTKKTPKEVFRYMMDCERKDKNKRIAFSNDEKRIKAFTEICGFSFERAVNHALVGCNEPAMLGAVYGGTSKGNILRCVETLFHKKSELIENTKTFDEFYAIFEKELLSDLDIVREYDNKYNLGRGRDINYVSTLFFNDCIENAKSLTQGGGNVVIAAPMMLGVTNLIDSVVTVKQFVFDEKRFTMKELAEALKANWKGFEDMRSLIVKKGVFFGNDDDRSNEIAQRIYGSIYAHSVGKRNVYGYPWLMGDITGYNIHHVWFGERTKATPDGRRDGEMLKYGLSQSEGRDKAGLTALLSSVAGADKNGIACGSTVTNLNVEAEMVRDDESFYKLCDMFEAYLQKGGTQFQLNYVSREDLLAAKENPENYSSLRVRVSGFSDYFVKLSDGLQEEIICRTVQK